MSEFHDQTVLKIKEMLERKLRKKSIPSFTLAHCYPDILFKDRHGKYIVIEVGSIKERSILKYLKDPTVREIRWFSKQGELIGTWVSDKFDEAFYNPQPDSIFTKELMEELEKEEIKGRSLDRIYFKCPICGDHKSFLFLKTESYGIGVRLICEDCHSRTSVAPDQPIINHQVRQKLIRKQVLDNKDNRLRKGWIDPLTRIN